MMQKTWTESRNPVIKIEFTVLFICQRLGELIKGRPLHLNQIATWTSICKYYAPQVDLNMNPACSTHLCVNGADVRFSLLTLHTACGSCVISASSVSMKT